MKSSIDKEILTNIGKYREQTICFNQLNNGLN